MANTRTKSYGNDDVYGDLDYVPRGGERPAKQHKPLTGRAGLGQADKIDQAEREKPKGLGGPSDLKDTPQDVLDNNAARAHELREQVFGPRNGGIAVSNSVEIRPVSVPQYPPAEIGDQARLFE